MERDDKPRSGIALGGIGAGSFELRQDGILRNWSIFNNYPLGTGEPLDWREDSMLFFVVRWEVEGEYPGMRILQVTEGYKVGAIQNHYYEFPWLTGVDRIEYEGRFPFVNMRFSDEQMPLDIELEAFSPFIPHDVKNSSLPAAIFNFTVTSRSEKPVHLMLMASMRNAVGYDVEDKYHLSNVLQREDHRLFEVTEGGMDESHSSFGAQVLASLAPDSTYYTGWEVHHPYYEYVIRHRELPDYDDTGGRNAEDPDTGELKALYNWYGSIAVSRRLENQESLDHTFVKSWHFP
ncbi:MAG: GH116 family glycosyl-hydrolase, partial [Armatimonadota bacterium]